MDKTEVKKKAIKTKPLPPAPPKETPIAGSLDPVLTKTLKRVGIVTVEQFNELSDNQVLEIPGIGRTRLLRIFKAIGRKPEQPEENK